MLPTDPLSKQFRLDEAHVKALSKLHIHSAEDLLYHIPTRYENIAAIKTIANLTKGESAIIYGVIKNLKTRKAWKSRAPIAEGVVADTSGEMKVIWFHQPYLAKMLHEGSTVKLSGTVTGSERGLYLANPAVENTPTMPGDAHESLFGEGLGNETFLPVYAETKGITSRWFFHTIQKLFRTGILEHIVDPIPEEILKRYNLPTLQTALVWIHAPKKESDASAARKRFAFEEVFMIQLAKRKNRAENDRQKARAITMDEKRLGDFVQSFPFEATAAQKKAIADIVGDFQKPHPMARLLEGDVGSGKTAVAAATAYLAATSRPNGQDFGNLQVAYMVPTEILAKQHFESFIQYFKGHEIPIGLLTSNECRKFPSKFYADSTQTERGLGADKTPWTDISKPQLLKWIANGEIGLVIGTHALIQKSVVFKDLAFVIIDEQHRFGTAQRFTLARGKTSSEKEEPFDPLLYRDLTYRIREAILTVKKNLGLGHKESIYSKALEEEFRHRNLTCSREVRIPIKYRTKTVGTYIPDFVIEDKVIIELKALPFIGTREKKQLWGYLKGSSYHLGLLVNFSNSTVDIQRVVYDTARTSASSPREEKSAFSPHLLSMTATPIPRTLALTIYGDLDLTLLDQMPHGRKPIITEIVTPNERTQMYEKIRRELQSGRQAYVICPRIDEPDPTKENALMAKSVKEEAKRLKKSVFQEYELGILHSKMKPSEKEEVMKKFTDGTIDILVATSVVEVGVNVPNATVILIEGAERFGLAQLHQLRGRVIRSNHQAYCFALAESQGAQTVGRLKAIKTAKNGFELAEHDLALRGSGELSGGKQWGVTDLAMEALKNIKMVEAARKEAEQMIKSDPTLRNHALLLERVETAYKQTHFE